MDFAGLALAGLIGLVLGGLLVLLWLRQGLEAARAEAASDLEQRAAAQARLEEALASLGRLETRLEDAMVLRDAAVTARAQAEQAVALARQETATTLERMQDWEKTKAEFMTSTKASVLETAQSLSTKLIEDHKRETAEAKAAAEQQIKATT